MISFKEAINKLLDSADETHAFTSIKNGKTINYIEWQEEMLEIKGCLKDFYDIIKQTPKEE